MGLATYLSSAYYKALIDIEWQASLSGRQVAMNLFLAKECLRRIFKALSHCLCVMELWDVRLAEFNQRVRGRRGLLNSLVSFYYSVLYSVPSALSILKGLVVALVEYF